MNNHDNPADAGFTRVSMETAIDNHLGPLLLRALELEPTLTLDQAIARVRHAAEATGVIRADPALIDASLWRFAKSLHRRAVVNPRWLCEDRKTFFSFYFLSAEAGHLATLIQQSDMLEEVASYYRLYGEHDALVLLSGTEEEASKMNERLKQYGYVGMLKASFSSTIIPFFHRYKTEYSDALRVTDDDVESINSLVEAYDQEDLIDVRSRLESDRILLGPDWDWMGEERLGTRITAFVGISVQGPGAYEITAEDILELLRGNEAIEPCLVHLFEVLRGQPYHYLAKLICLDIRELDAASSAIGQITVGMVRLKGHTYVVVSESRKPVTVAPRTGGILAPQPELAELMDMAIHLVTELGAEATVAFNDLETPMKLVVLGSLAELDAEFSAGDWDEDRRRRIQQAITAFTQACLSGELQHVVMTGPVGEIAATVEQYVKYVIRTTIETVFEGNVGQAQRTLKLAHRDTRRITLGQGSLVLRTLREVPECTGPVRAALEDDWLDRLTKFSELRNRWAHGEGEAGLTGTLIIDAARAALVEGMQLIRWLGGINELLVGSTQDELDKPLVELSVEAKSRQPGVFLSYSSEDHEMAESIARALHGVGLTVWYADWAIEPGDSIVSKVNEALAKYDTLAVLMNPSWIRSGWVERELSAALMEQLSRGGVRLIPIMIGDAELPPLLRAVEYIDMRENFQKGILKLITLLLGASSRGKEAV